MLLIDTSIWIEVLRDKSKIKATKLKTIIAGKNYYLPIFTKMELLQGITIRSNIDCAISIMAMENNLILYHCDRDFEAIAKHTILKQKKLNSWN